MYRIKNFSIIFIKKNYIKYKIARISFFRAKKFARITAKFAITHYTFVYSFEKSSAYICISPAAYYSSYASELFSLPNPSDLISNIHSRRASRYFARLRISQQSLAATFLYFYHPE